jgi:hypothetical protein
MNNSITTAVVILMFAAAASVSAQSTATLQGRVSDTSGSAFPGVTVRVLSSSTGFDRAVATDSEGQFHIFGIPAGPYDISAAAPGFTNAVIEDLVFEVGRTLVRDFLLEVGGTREEVIVLADPALIETASASVAHAVLSSTVQDVPSQWTAVRRPRAARARFSRPVADRVLNDPDSRPRIARHQHGGKPDPHPFRRNQFGDPSEARSSAGGRSSSAPMRACGTGRGST